ncbi:unnamed protein product [Pleuronectes platessa]|uniref:Uncharacterized protein n=1 Tax=Pleuronectes platessa TaxID=8262 RepID=A0A9N7VF90_PLEPL|nr:unnamed protein product [Pleuronectes platessa]
MATPQREEHEERGEPWKKKGDSHPDYCGPSPRRAPFFFSCSAGDISRLINSHPTGPCERPQLNVRVMGQSRRDNHLLPLLAAPAYITRSEGRLKVKRKSQLPTLLPAAICFHNGESSSFESITSPYIGPADQDTADPSVQTPLVLCSTVHEAHKDGLVLMQQKATENIKHICRGNTPHLLDQVSLCGPHRGADRDLWIISC